MPHDYFEGHHSETIYVAFPSYFHCVCELCNEHRNRKIKMSFVMIRLGFLICFSWVHIVTRSTKILLQLRMKPLPGAMYPYVPARPVQLEESFSMSLAVPKSETLAS